MTSPSHDVPLAVSGPGAHCPHRSPDIDGCLDRVDASVVGSIHPKHREPSMRRSAGIVAIARLSTVALALSAAPAFAAAADHGGARLSLTSVSNPKPSLVSG